MIQLFLFLLTITAITLIQFDRRKLRLAGCAVGVTAQPLWFYETIINEQWGMFAITTVFLGIYIWGGVKHFLALRRGK